MHISNNQISIVKGWYNAAAMLIDRTSDVSANDQREDNFAQVTRFAHQTVLLADCLRVDAEAMKTSLFLVDNVLKHIDPKSELTGDVREKKAGMFLFDHPYAPLEKSPDRCLAKLVFSVMGKMEEMGFVQHPEATEHPKEIQRAIMTLTKSL